ncbi:hypothetical protein JXD38_01045, partial [candidate division WOR-3 bacterium]|nr:hypothetical protein [candidate division WOR-3 bacterium]
MFLRLGSEVAILNFADLDTPRVTAELQLGYVWGQVAVRDTLLITGGNGIDIWSVADARSPNHISTIEHAVGDFALFDSLVHFISGDTFQTFSIADPTHPYRIGIWPESGYATTATCSTVVLVHDGHLSFVDVSNPTAPHTAGTFDGAAFSAVTRGDLCCASFMELPGADQTWFLTLDISNPSAPRQLARLDSVFGYDLYLADSLVFVSGRSAAYPEGFRIVSIADSAHPRLKGTCGVSDYRWGVWADPADNRAFVASEPGGLAVIDFSNQSAPIVDTTLMHADQAYDISIDGDRAYVANWRGGLRILDISNPTCPTELGGYDSASIASNTTTASDSFAFVGWCQTPYFLSVDVSDPASPKHVGGTVVQTIPEDMVLRDSFVYLAGRLRFNVVNVARPREPTLVGSCVTQDGVYFGLAIQDTLAFIAGGPSLEIVNISDPSNPRVIGSGGRPSTGVAVRDTFAYVPYPYDTLLVYSTADPTNLRLLSA